MNKPSSHIRDGPRKSLVFPTPDKPADTDSKKTDYKSSVTQGFKRRIDEMYALLSDGEESDKDLLDEIENVGSQSSSNQAKRARISTSSELNTRTSNHASSSRETRPPVNSSPPRIAVRTQQVLTRPAIGKECIPLTGSDGGRRVYLHLNKDESSQVGGTLELFGLADLNVHGQKRESCILATSLLADACFIFSM